MKQNTECLFTGTILAIAIDLDIDEILCMRLKSPEGRYPVVTYQQTVYAQLEKRHIGETLHMREITPGELKAVEHAAVWSRYREYWPDWNESRLLYADEKRPPRMFLHTVSDGSEYLVVAGDVEIRQEQAGRQRYWELGYHYRDFPFHVIDEREERI